MSEPKTTLIKDALVISREPDSQPFTGWVSIRSDSIESVGDGLPPESTLFDSVIHARGKPLIPGLANMHAHSHCTITRGRVEDLPLEPWLNIVLAEAAGLTDQRAYYSALVSFGEALLSGTTCVLDMCLKPEAVMRAAEVMGIRAFIAPYVADSMDFAPTLEENERLVSGNGKNGDRVQACIGMHDIETCSDAQIEAGAQFAKDNGVVFHTHCAETKDWCDKTIERTGKTPAEQFDALGALGPKTVLAHCVWLTESDQELVAERGVHIAHCPQSNLKLGAGIAPVPTFRERGINVVLGSDGAQSNNRLDMFDTMKFASLVPKGLSCDPVANPSDSVMDMATVNAGEALGIKCGQISPGFKADLVLMRTDRIHLQPIHAQTIVPNLVHSAHGGDVDTVLVGGEVVVEDGRLLAMDEETLAERARGIAEVLLES